MNGSNTGAQILNLLSGRLARNMYFWAAIIWSRNGYSFSRAELFFTGIIMIILMLFFYTNNLLLLPRFLAVKKYREYFARYAVLVAIISFLYVLCYKVMLTFFPKTSIWKISPLLSSKETMELSFEGFLHDQPFYFMTLFIAGLIFAMSWYVMDYQRQQKIMESVKKKQLETELHFLKSQINPHFLFNTMNNLYTLTLKKSDNAPETVFRLSSILRYLLYQSNTECVFFEKEKEIMLAYIDLELLRITDKSNITFEITSDRNYRIPPLLWMPVIENIFKHGTGFVGRGFAIEYKFSIQNNLLTLYSRNKCKPNDPSGNTSEQGIGIINLRKRLELLFSKRHTIEIKKEHHFYVIQICIQLN